MKKIVLLSLVTFLWGACSKTESPPNPTTPIVPTPPSPPASVDSLIDWVKIGKPSSSVQDIWFTNQNTGFITNDTLILTSTNNGGSWSTVPNTTDPHIFNIQFLDDQNGFVQGNNLLGTTYDGGSTWSFKQLASTNALLFQFTDILHGFFLDPLNGLYKTNDGGDHWVNTHQIGITFFFIDSLNGFLMDGSRVDKTIDGGANWQPRGSGFTATVRDFLKMQFLDSLHGYCATENGLLKTTDGGFTWTTSLPPQQNPTALTSFIIPYFLDINNGYCLSRNIIYKTTDGGINWTMSCKLGNDTFSGFHFLDMNTGWAGTFGGYVLRLK